ncbi:MAG: phage major capsid protein, partial [Acinetobacter sp.]
MTLQEHIDAIKAAINDRVKKMSEIMTKAAKTNGATPEGDDETEVQGLEEEIKNLEANLARLEKIQKSQGTLPDATTPVEGDTSEKGLNSTQGKTTIVKTESNVPKGIGFALMVKSMAVASSSNGAITADAVLKNWGAPESVCKAVIQKALIGGTNEANFGASLVELQNYTGEFIELLRGKTAVDKLAPKMRQVP